MLSDMWKAYDCLKEEDCSHHTAKHSLNFVDPDTGAHTHYYGDDPFRNINVIRSTQRCVNCFSHQCINCPCSDRQFIEERKKRQIHRLGEDLRTEINCKGIKRGVRREVSENFIKLCFDLQNKYNSR